MKIALCASMIPFVPGGARSIVEWLEAMLVEAGHRVERVDLPHVDAPDRIFDQMAAYRWVDLDAADRIICLRPPAHLISHANKILWFIHHIRAFYDLWDSPYRGFPDDGHHRAIRDALRDADTAAMKEARAVFTNSQVVSRRVQQFNGVDSEVLYPPLYRADRFRCGDCNDEIVYVCRMEHHKRQHLLIEAMRHTRTAVRLRLCGPSSDPEYVAFLNMSIREAGLADRVSLENVWISEGRKVDLLAHCLAVAYVPLDEDSYGYPSLEASHSGKALLTTSDSGGVLELVQNGRNGLVVPATPHALADALDQLYTDRKRTVAMGCEAAQRLRELKIEWPHVLERLLA